MKLNDKRTKEKSRKEGNFHANTQALYTKNKTKVPKPIKPQYKIKPAQSIDCAGSGFSFSPFSFKSESLLCFYGTLTEFSPNAP